MPDSGPNVPRFPWRRIRRTGLVVALLAVLATMAAHAASPAPSPSPSPLVSLTLGGGGRQEWVVGIRLMVLMTVLTIAPAILIMTTSFTRIMIVLSFLRTGLGLGQTPGNQILIAYALFLTVMIMRPVWTEVQAKGIEPYADGRLSWSQAIEQGARPLRGFMLKHTRKADLQLFYEISRRPRPAAPEDVDLDVLLASFVTSELRTAFQMGFALLIPFLVLDIVVASVLTSMGMMMLPPTMVSLPFKILVFVLVDGWALVARSLVTSFH